MAGVGSKAERLFSLTCALAITQIGYTKREIWSSIPAYGYTGDPKQQVALDKMFDRDKEELRAAGVNIINENYLDPENNQHDRYRIPNEHFEWPADLNFSAREISLLNLAARAWTSASMGSTASQGLMRLRALGETPESLEELTLLPSITVRHRHFVTIEAAIDRGVTIAFRYRKEGEDPQRREVQPWALEHANGQWLLVCWSPKDSGIRRFLLKRIVSPKIEVTSEVFERPSQELLDQATQELRDFEASQEAEIRVKPGSSAWTHFRMDEPGASSDGILRQNFMDAHLLADELRQFGADIEILRPRELKVTFERGLRKIVEAHHG